MTPLIGKSKNRFLILLEKNYSVFVLESFIKGLFTWGGGGRGGPQVGEVTRLGGVTRLFI